MLRCPQTCSCSTAAARQYPRRQHHWCLRQTGAPGFTDSGGLPAVHANHQENNKRRLPSILVGSSAFAGNLAHLVFSLNHGASASLSCLRLAPSVEISGNACAWFPPYDISEQRCSSAHSNNHRRFSFAAEQTDKSEPRFSLVSAGCVSGGQRNPS